MMRVLPVMLMLGLLARAAMAQDDPCPAPVQVINAPVVPFDEKADPVPPVDLPAGCKGPTYETPLGPYDRYDANGNLMTQAQATASVTPASLPQAEGQDLNLPDGMAPVDAQPAETPPMDLNSLQNLQDVRLAYSFKPKPNMSIALEGHAHFLNRTTDSWYNVAGVGRAGGAANAGTGYAISPNFSRSLGQELDLVVGWHVIPSSQIEVGVSRYFRGNYVKQSLSTLGSKDANYCYVQLTVSL